jgi:hypothetical protein
MRDPASIRGDDDMTGWVFLISALVGCVSVIVHLVLQCVVAIWSLKDVEDRHQHAIELLKVLQRQWPTAIDRVRAAATGKVPQSGDGPSYTVGDDHA